MVRICLGPNGLMVKPFVNEMANESKDSPIAIMKSVETSMYVLNGCSWMGTYRYTINSLYYQAI